MTINRGICLLLLAALLLGLGCVKPAGESPTGETTATPESVSVATNVPAPTSAAPTAVPTATPTPVPTDTPEPTATPALYGLVIGVDPGHQQTPNRAQEPVAPGASETKAKVASGTMGVSSHVREYVVNLDVGLLLRDMLVAAGATVIMTHDIADVNISNSERAILFNEAEVDLAIRLHCNGSDDRKVHGAFMLIPKEYRTTHYEENLAAARCIIDAYCAETGIAMLKKEGITYRGDQTGFNWCTRPIVCIEMGHMTNAEEDCKLTDPDFQVKMAQGILNGIIAYFQSQNG